MAKIQKTKTALKAQRDALARYKRYLPTLELKKQQLRMEVNRVSALLEEKREARRSLIEEIEPWIRLFCEDVGLEELIGIEALRRGTDNVAGITVPVVEEVRFRRESPDPYDTPPWIDPALDAVERLLRLKLEEGVLEETRDLLQEELRITSQRVNLFEKIKIPEANENIRIIRIALGDEQAAAVARAKTAKGKMVEVGAEAE